MRISTKGRYSLIALLYIALLEEGSFASAREISDATGISEGYLEQLFILLRKTGIIQGVRGPQGGYFLERAAKDISAGEVLRAVEGSLSPTECVSGSACPNESRCQSRQTWGDLNEGINEFADSITLADLVKDYNTHKEPEYSI
ncbi:MAG: Rrf2 family transcriptional regulator [Spirochaetaceae bacterium]|nr:Rrf2 family transcriptional regulator [Spirochaetaceae bacterium]GMO18318.1 MAG: Rrf2 family transcriptional regulator [Termitinemataceae bacterium]